MNLIIHTDGGARGNPGPAAVGVVIEEAGNIIAEFGKKIGETTNNVAEYMAVIEAFKKVISLSAQAGEKLKVKSIYFYLDSTLVVNQLNGVFKIKDARLRNLMLSVRILEQQAGGVITYTAVRREQNTRADYFVNKALDS